MKKTISLILVMVLMIALGVGIVIAIEQPVEAGARGHLDWDTYDQLWRCIGTPTNCAFVE